MTEQTVRSNAPEFSVSELAGALKKTLEDSYGRVRVRGELSRVKIHTSGHMYSDLKDQDALINVVCWRGTLAGLSIRPEEGLEVVCTGRITTYPARSNYQLVIEQMELAGQGALLKMLEERRKKLTAEGLFDAARKKPLPFIPERIGVITSPTGAVIRDILHRLADRFPRPVMIWPVAVQGTDAAGQIAAAIAGFNALPDRERPDLLIVARGGGSLEDLMAFNEEAVVRAAAASRIPLIAAVGHETDTTLIDYAADLRAPTPTAAAEMAVPVRINLLAQVQDDGQRLLKALRRALSSAHDRLAQRAARLARPARLLELKTQALDHAGEKLAHAFGRFLSRKRESFVRAQSRLAYPRNRLGEAQRLLSLRGESLRRAAGFLLAGKTQRLGENVRLLESFSFKSVLARGFALIRDESGRLVASTAKLSPRQSVTINLADGIAGATINTVATGEGADE